MAPSSLHPDTILSCSCCRSLGSLRQTEFLDRRQNEDVEFVSYHLLLQVVGFPMKEHATQGAVNVLSELCGTLLGKSCSNVNRNCRACSEQHRM